jgi:hypothetical protein
MFYLLNFCDCLNNVIYKVHVVLSSIKTQAEKEKAFTNQYRARPE